jgi:hypothetical protein
LPVNESVSLESGQLEKGFMTGIVLLLGASGQLQTICENPEEFVIDTSVRATNRIRSPRLAASGQ